MFESSFAGGVGLQVCSLKSANKLFIMFSGHTQAGHILHLNLREEMMPYRFVIGRILLDKINYAKYRILKFYLVIFVFKNSC